MADFCILEYRVWSMSSHYDGALDLFINKLQLFVKKREYGDWLNIIQPEAKIRDVLKPGNRKAKRMPTSGGRWTFSEHQFISIHSCFRHSDVPVCPQLYERFIAILLKSR